MKKPKFEDYQDNCRRIAAAFSRNFPAFTMHEFFSLSTDAFEQASNAWDGIRDFKPLLRTCMITSINQLLRREKRYKERESTVFNGLDSKVAAVADDRGYEDPAKQVDWKDWQENLTYLEKEIVKFLTTNEDVRGIGPKKVRGLLKEYLRKELKWSFYQIEWVEKALELRVKQRMLGA